MRPHPLICVSYVEASSRWYQRLLGCQSGHGGAEYERLMDGDRLIMQLHAWDIDHHHGPIADVSSRPYGNGVLLWFEVDDIDEAIARAEELKAEVVMDRHRNPPTGDGGPNGNASRCLRVRFANSRLPWEYWIRDPDGYAVVLASSDGSAS